MACDLACRHCRANAQPEPHPDQLTTEEGKALIRSVHELGSMLVFTGGDPMKRPDLFELVAYARSLGVPVAVTPSTTPTLTRAHVHELKALGVAAMGVSIDGPNPEVHDGFRDVPGTFECSRRALLWAAEAGMPVQVNTTVCGLTLGHLAELYRFLRDEASPPVRRWSLFLLVPVGRGVDLGMPSPQAVEALFAWVYHISKDAPFHVSTVEAPHYRRFFIEQKLREGVAPELIGKLAKRMGFGIRDGNGVVFVSHTGDVLPAGFLPKPVLGNVRERPLDRIYEDSTVLRVLQDPTAFHGACGSCEFLHACGGSRARAFAMTGDVLGTDPSCAFGEAHEPFRESA